MRNDGGRYLHQPWALTCVLRGIHMCLHTCAYIPEYKYIYTHSTHMIIQTQRETEKGIEGDRCDLSQ